MRKFASSLVLFSLSVALSACTCCNTQVAPCPKPCSIEFVCPATGCDDLTWPDANTLADLNQIMANAVLQKAKTNCLQACDDGWDLVIAAALNCKKNQGGHNCQSTGYHHNDRTCAQLSASVARARVLSADDDPSKWQACLSELNHEDSGISEQPPK